MNRIQLLSREIETRNLKLQMGIDPAVDIDHQTVRHMWRELNHERLKKRLSEELKNLKTVVMYFLSMVLVR